MDRFFAEDISGAGTRLVLSPEETRHLKVRRVSPGDPVAVFDGSGREADARLVEFDGKRALLELTEVRVAAPDAEPLITVATAIPKGSRMADLVRTCTEAGAWKIQPMITARSVVRPETGKPSERWAKIAREAAKQSRRLHVPEVPPVAGFGEVVQVAAGADVKIIADSRAAAPLRDALDGMRGVGTAFVLVGPEGGFTGDEIDQATSRGFAAARLPGPVMRVETAAPVLVATILFACA